MKYNKLLTWYIYEIVTGCRSKMAVIVKYMPESEKMPHWNIYSWYYKEAEERHWLLFK